MPAMLFTTNHTTMLETTLQPSITPKCSFPVCNTCNCLNAGLIAWQFVWVARDLAVAADQQQVRCNAANIVPVYGVAKV